MSTRETVPVQPRKAKTMTTSIASRIAAEATRQNVAANDPRFAEFVSMQYRTISGGLRGDRTYGTPTDASPELVAQVRAELSA